MNNKAEKPAVISCNGILINQISKHTIATCVLKFTDVIQMVSFTARSASEIDPFGVKLTNDDQEYFQRIVADNRTKSIAQFMLSEIYKNKMQSSSSLGVLPTTILLAVSLNDEYSNENIGDYNVIDNDNGCNVRLRIPADKSALVVDGQHRLVGMKLLYDCAKTNDFSPIGVSRLDNKFPGLQISDIYNSISGFSFVCTLLINFDLWEQGKVFAEVNFNQKPVNRSLYFDIFGSYANPDKNDIFLAHQLVLHLNNNDKSPIKGFIKLLGNGPGFFSQAAFVNGLLPMFRSNRVFNIYIQNFIEGGDKYKSLPHIMRAYFTAVKEVFRQTWPNEVSPENSKYYTHILLKTTGLNVLLRLLGIIYQNLLSRHSNMIDADELTLTKEFIKALEFIKPYESEYFSNSGKYAGAGSAGLQSRLFREASNRIISGMNDRLGLY